jgi:putative transposase
LAHPRHARQAARDLAQGRPRVARRNNGRKRRKKAVHLLAQAQQTGARPRADFHHQTALAFLRPNDTLALDDLRGAQLVTTRPLAKRLREAGWAAVRTILAAQAACGRGVGGARGTLPLPARRAVEAGSACGGGERVQKSLCVRTHLCPACGLVVDRDENAAIKRQRAGPALRGLATVAAGTNRAAPSL